MAVKINFEETMKQRTFAELVDIVKRNRGDYVPEAVIAAETELEKRKTAGEKWEAPPKEEPERKLTTAEKASMTLPLFWKIETFILPGLFNLRRARELKEEGYTKQSDQIWRWFFYGLLFYVGLLVALFIFAMIVDNI
jgi:hypothetical protein